MVGATVEVFALIEPILKTMGTEITLCGDVGSGQVVKLLNINYLEYKYPRLTKLIKWKYQRKLNKIKKVWLSGELTGESFIKFKSYRLFIYKN